MELDVTEILEENEEEIISVINQKEKDKLLTKSGPFGAPGGKEITNKKSIMSEIDAALGVDKPPAVEYIFVEPATDLCLPWLSFLGFSRNPYGHAAVRYTLPTGEQVLMNIVGVPHKQMVNFLDPVEYLYGTSDFDNGAEQGGIYNRHMISVRLEEWPADRILELHNYYLNLKERTKNQNAKFSLLFSPLYNLLARLLPGTLAERGNCARYTSKGLAEGGIISSANMWPKAIWVDIFEKEGRKNPKNVHVVSYRRIDHAQHFYGRDTKSISAVAPLESLSNIFYFNLERFADVRVEVPNGEYKAVVVPRRRTAQPSFFRYHHVSIAAGVMISGFWLFIAWTRRDKVWNN